jgi:hypothetical protein
MPEAIGAVSTHADKVLRFLPALPRLINIVARTGAHDLVRTRNDDGLGDES